MKKLLLLTAVLTNLLVFGQDNEVSKDEIIVPLEVKLAFEKEFPNQNPIWQTEYRGDNADEITYETNVNFEKRIAVVFYDKLGDLKAVEVEIRTRELPEEIVSYLEKNYMSHPVVRMVKVYKNKKADITYEVGIQDKGKFADLVFDSTGYFLTRIEKTN